MTYTEPSTQQLDAAAYRRLADAITDTMPDYWDGEDDETTILIAYVQHMAIASHGVCQRCLNPVTAGERCETLGNDPRQIRHYDCEDEAAR